MIVLLTAALVAIADQLTKSWVRSYAEGQVIFQNRLLEIIRSHNTGAAFGMFRDYSFVLTVAALFAVLIILVLVIFFWRRVVVFAGRPGRVALGLVLGGTLGNLIDRLRFGYVTDFIDFRFWPSFNIADASISVGVVLFAYSLLFLTREKEHDLPSGMQR